MIKKRKSLPKKQTGGSNAKIVKVADPIHKIGDLTPSGRNIKSQQDADMLNQMEKQKSVKKVYLKGGAIKKRQTGGATTKKKGNTTYTKTSPAQGVYGGVTTISKTKNGKTSKTKSVTTSPGPKGIGQSKITKTKNYKATWWPSSDQDQVKKSTTKVVSPAKAKRVAKRFAKKMK